MNSRNMTLKEQAAWLRQVKRVMPDNIRAALEDLSESEQGAAEMIFEIVANTPSGIVPGKPDRIWTGDMQISGDSLVAGSGGHVHFEFGWLRADPEGYISIQEHGGYLPALGNAEEIDGEIYVTPMNALEQIAELYLQDGVLWDYIERAVKAGLAGKHYG